jgi:SIR2-like domain
MHPGRFSENESAGAFVRAIVARDSALLSEASSANPIATQYRLDAAMRGLVFGSSHAIAFDTILNDEPKLRDWVNWLVEQDRLLRRRLGWAQREGDLAVLRAAYRAGDLALAVGAGISTAAKMPDWNHLVIEMINRALRYGGPEHRQALADAIRAGTSGDYVMFTVRDRVLCVLRDQVDDVLAKELTSADPATCARLEDAKAQLESASTQRAMALREATAATQAVFGTEFAAELRRVLFGRTLYRTKVHPAIARMVRPKSGPPGTLTPRLHTILTYNFDDLLETALREAGHECWVHLSKGGEPGKLRLGEPFGHPDRPSAVNVYHVHGFCPAPRGAYALVPLDNVDLVFSESQYRVTYGDNASWTRRVQGALFGSSPCLIIGSSLSDDDAVAQLATAHRKRPGWFSYVVLQLSICIPSNEPEPAGAALDAIAAPYRAMGLSVLWIRSHDEIPELLDAISQPPPDWKAPDLGVQLPLDLIREPDTPTAAVTLGLILARLRDVAGAETAFGCARASSDAAAVAAATRNLAVLRLENGDVPGARAALVQTIALGHTDQSPRAMVDLGLLLLRLGDRDGGLATLEQAIKSGHPEWARYATAERARFLEGDRADSSLHHP